MGNDCSTSDGVCANHAASQLRIATLEASQKNNDDLFKSLLDTLQGIKTQIGQAKTAIYTFVVFLVAQQYGLAEVVTKLFIK